jgi:cellobiose-specific phosphotransferase system component IIA
VGDAKSTSKEALEKAKSTSKETYEKARAQAEHEMRENEKAMKQTKVSTSVRCELLRQHVLADLGLVPSIRLSASK